MKLYVTFLSLSFNFLISYCSSNISQYNEYDSVILKKYLEYCASAIQSVNSDSIIYFSGEAIKILEKHDIEDYKAYIFHGIGNMQSGRTSLALEYFFKAATLYKNSGNQIGLATSYNYVAQVYNLLENYENSNNYIKKAINIFENEKDSSRLAYGLHNLAFNYHMQNYLLDSSLYFYSKAKKIFDKLNVETESAYCTGNSGLVYFKQGKIDLAEKNLEIAINILQEYDDSYAISEFMITQAKILFQKGSVKDAINCGLECYNLSVTNNISERIRDITLNLAEFYSKNDQFDSAYYYHKIYAAYNDSLKNIKTVQQMADLRTTYEVSQKQVEVDRLENRRVFYMVAIGALVLIILLSFGLIYMYNQNLKRERKFTKKLEDQGKELQNSNQVKDKFFSIISHDLRSPLSSLSAISLMINESLEHDNKEILVEASDYIDKTVYSLTALLENLLNWAMSEQGRFPYAFGDVELKSLISEEVKTLATIAISKDIHLALQLQDNLVIHGDKNSLQTIIRNLLSNAYKFTPKGGEVKIIANVAEDTNYARIVVSDNGVGIDKDKLSNIFVLKADKSTRGTDKEKGLGLGLTLIYEFVCKNNGNISVQSNSGEGTTFTLTFPLKS